MLTRDFLTHIEDILNQKIINHKSVSGGDISLAYKLQAESDSLFLKVNNAHSALSMFQTEEIGLNTINNSNTISVPKVYFSGSFNNNAYILMNWVEAKSPTGKDMELLGVQLAKMHLDTSDTFGLNSNNFIGSLPQSNTKHTNWLDFYIEERLQPQLKLAITKRLLQDNEVPSIKKMKEVCFPLFRDVKPSLLHGDLWSGNYLISSDGLPYLIDPAVYHGHNEVDIAMTKLFGGFSISFYDAYHKIIPLEKYTESRIELYQLYYLLVHLNLFGRSYYPSVINILKKYF